jgi:enamine deaminase RidA (YjgF/YER057c/UK114 family)
MRGWFDAMRTLARQGRRTSMAHERFRHFNTMGRWPNQTIDYDVSLMVRATVRSVFIAGLTGFDLDGKFHGKDDCAAQADPAMKNLKILAEEAGGTLAHVCKVTTYLLDRAHRESVYNTAARHLRGAAPCGTGLIVSGLAMADVLDEFDVDVVIPA